MNGASTGELVEVNVPCLGSHANQRTYVLILRPDGTGFSYTSGSSGNAVVIPLTTGNPTVKIR